MATNAQEFKLGIKNFGTKSQDRHKKLTKAVMLYVVRGCVLGTRVDTGRMRGNWQITEGDPAEGYKDVTDKSGGSTIAEGTRVVSAASGERPLWAHNGVPYAKYVNEWDKIVETVAHGARTWLASQRGRL